MTWFVGIGDNDSPRRAPVADAEMQGLRSSIGPLLNAWIVGPKNPGTRNGIKTAIQAKIPSHSGETDHWFFMAAWTFVHVPGVDFSLAERIALCEIFDEPTGAE